MRVQYHTISAAQEGQNPTQRFSITPNREKGWVCNKPRTEPVPDSSPVQWHQLARFCPMTNLPNMYLDVAWEVKLETVSGLHFLSFERPYLVWAKALTFSKDQWFRWA